MEKLKKKRCESRFPYWFLTDFTKLFFCESTRYLILASSQRKLRGFKFFKFDVTVKKLKNSNSSKI